MSLIIKIGQMYDSVARTHLFYEENHFDFTEHCNYQIITFLVALTDERRNRIQHLALSVSAYRSIPRSSELFTIIAASKGVKTLRLQFTDTHSGPHPTTWAALKGYKEVFHAVEGLKKVEVFGKVCTDVLIVQFMHTQQDPALTFSRLSNRVLQTRKL